MCLRRLPFSDAIRIAFVKNILCELRPDTWSPLVFPYYSNKSTDLGHLVDLRIMLLGQSFCAFPTGKAPSHLSPLLFSHPYPPPGVSSGSTHIPSLDTNYCTWNMGSLCRPLGLSDIYGPVAFTPRSLSGHSLFKNVTDHMFSCQCLICCTTACVNSYNAFYNKYCTRKSFFMNCTHQNTEEPTVEGIPWG